MAGAGYKLFNTGDVLTAAQVNTYLQEQVVMVFADAAARTTALSGVLAEGMVSYLKSTKVVEIYNGTAWASLDDPNAIQNTIVDAKGDLIAATGNDVPARLAVGSNGDTLVADSAATTGLRWQSAYNGNFFINGSMEVWQRGTSFSSPAGNTYTADRIIAIGGSGTNTISRDSTNVLDGTQYSMKITSGSAGAFYNMGMVLEKADVLSLAGKTITYSIYVRKNATYTGNVSITIQTNTSADTLGGTWTEVATANGTPSDSAWQRLSVTYAVPSGTQGLRFRFNQTTTQSSGAELYWAQAQIEYGSVATTFKRAGGGTLQGELAACQRYYWRIQTGAGNTRYITSLGSTSTTDLYGCISNPVPMRTNAPTSVDFSALSITEPNTTLRAVTAITISSAFSSPMVSGALVQVASGLTGNVWYGLQNTSSSGYIGFSAEL